ncbi:hypothetical protein [Arthrobacter sp. SLBN-53]|uniref:hypothetical protein n=1 Tax=Arthrobacter sp. SLBN-53 TaxID=2768412 RepID=UPI00114EA0D4|nr:hypothetical protein [Arthrobacter sp. SLBN-53]TQK29396.1 hypothetical protein FBY28_2399 [Arthrobacter sp. SLBN-53]
MQANDERPLSEILDELERRVAARFIEKRCSESETSETALAFDWTAEWLNPTATALAGQTLEISTVGKPLPPPLQFPRPQWITYPNRRVVILITCDRALDLWDDLTLEQRAQIAFLLEHGGRERIA